jgi:TonB-linked SusC/RagA family outer membrane protein
MEKKCKWIISSHKGKLKLLLLLQLTLILSFIAPLRTLAGDNLPGVVGQNNVQQLIITGTVTDDATNESLPGVNVRVEGTTIGTTTDINGQYTIEVPNAEAILVYSFIGYLTQNIQVAGQTVIDVKLVSAVETLEEVVVVGYGTQKKETLTGSIATVGGNEIVKSPQPNVTNSLTGKLPGLMVNERSGEPGREGLDILIRGTGTIDTDPNDGINANAPLVIIDGVERGQIERLNPEDIESISVLKDASAAIYGARAANGVIIVTTKSGKLGKPVFSLSYNTAFQHPTQIPEMLDAVAYAQVYNEGDWYRQGRPATYIPFYSDEAIQKFGNGSDPVLYPNTDWMGEVLKPYSLEQRTSFSVNGGTETVKYLISFAGLHQGSAFRHMPTDYKQYNIRAKVDVTLNENVSIGANINGIFNDREYTFVNNGTNFINILTANPTLPAVYPNGLLAGGRFGQSPLLLDQRGYNNYYDTPIYSTFTATYKIPFIKGLKVDASFNYDIRNEFQKTFQLPYYYHVYNVSTGEYDKEWADGAKTVELTDRYSKWTTMLYNFRITYENTFGNHHMMAMVGQEQQKNTYSWVSAYRKNFVSSAIDQIDVGSTAKEDKDNGGSASAGAYNNYFGRLNYDYKSKYLAEFLFRYDGSQIFPEGKRYGFFPGVSLGWRLSEEEFFQAALPDVDQLKLRFSYGEIGNDRVGQYQYLQSYSFGNNYVFGGTDVPGIYANVMPNPNITWEVSKKTDVGLETSLWNGLLGMEFTYFTEKRSNILVARSLSIPAILGFSGLPDENIGKVDNHGFELILRHRNSFNKLNYNVEGNMSFARSKIIFMDETPPAEAYQAQTGHPVGSGLYYETDGLFNTPEELAGYPHQSGTQVGDLKIVDVNDDGVIDAKDRIRVDKSNTPEIVFGLNIGMQYQNFDLSLFFQGQTSAYMDDNDYTYGFASLGNSNFTNACVERAKDHWTVDNPNGTMPRADAFQPGSTTFFLFDATFIRLKSMEFGYSLPKGISSKIGLEDIRVYASGYNLLTWAKEIKWADPESSGGYLYYPQQRIINLGINVKF